MEFSDSATVAKVGFLLCQGTAQLAAGSRDVPMDGSTRSALMASLIEESDAKRRVVQGVSASALPSMVGKNVKICCGLRGVRVGEASNPGPPKYWAKRRVVDSDDDVLTSLEHELTSIDPSSQSGSASGSLHRQSDVLDTLEQDLMSHRIPKCEARSQSSIAIAASQSVRPTRLSSLGEDQTLFGGGGSSQFASWSEPTH